MGQRIDLYASIGKQRYRLRFIDDNTEYVDVEISSHSPVPLPPQRYRVARDAILRRVETGTDQTIDEMVRRYLDSLTAT